MTPLLATAATTAIQQIIGQKVIPALTNLAKSVKMDFLKNVEPMGTHFEQYLRRTYESLSILNTLVFRNEQKRLRDLYIPLTLVKEDAKYRHSESGIKINGYPKDLIIKYKRVLITDTAGMGKSTMTKIMFLSAIDEEAGIPFYVELRKLSAKHLVLDEIRDQLGSLTEEFDDSLMRSFFQSGGFIIFFDGFDEISLPERKVVTEDIKRFIEKAPDNYYIMTSRFEQALSGFGDFYSLGIRPLKKEEAFSLLKKYDSGGNTSQHLIEVLKSGMSEKINSFLQNPLLVSLLFIGFDYKPEIPLKIHLFYNQVFEAYFNRHDLSKDSVYIHEKQSGLDMADFEKMLRAIGYICLKLNSLEYSRTDLLDIIEKARKLSCISLVSSEAMMHDLLHAVPLLCQDGINYKWVHRSMQEYFAADFINRDSGIKKSAILNALIQSSHIDSYMNLLELYGDLDSETFLRIIVLPVLDNFIGFIEKPDDTSDAITKRLVRRRRELIYGRDLYLYVFSKKELRKNTDELFRILRDSLYYKPSNHFRSHINKTLSIGMMCVPKKEDLLATLICQKFPEIRSGSIIMGREELTYLDESKLYPVSETLLIDKRGEYERINNLLSYPFGPSLQYEEAMVLRKRVNQMLSDTDSVFNDLFDL